MQIIQNRNIEIIYNNTLKSYYVIKMYYFLSEIITISGVEL